MGSGSDVAKNAADIVLLNDDFSAIVIGVEQGRIMFDNLKKSFVYALSVNIAELFPVLVYIIVQIPVPLSSLLMLAICLGTDMWPAIALAYERGELDIMERQPRNSKRDHLVSAKLMSFCYVQTGSMQAFCGMLVYFWCMNDWGFKLSTLLYINGEQGFYPEASDVYDPNLPNYGNSNFGKAASGSTLQWGTTNDSKIDVRLFYFSKLRSDWSKCRWDPADESIPRFWRHSYVTDSQICYTAEALPYAQSAYFIGCICT
jgi:sodium/potassium-transporting ATPase subunit alpha